MRNRNWADILAKLDTKSKVIALIALIAEALFVAALFKLPEDQILWALITCGIILILAIVAIMYIKNEHQTSMKPLESTSESLQDYTKIFQISDAVEFFNKVAHRYDERNSIELLETHRSVINEIEKRINMKTPINILDLGGGTGKLIAAQFYNKGHINWTYVDQSTNMAQQFKDNLDNTQLNTIIHIDDIYKICDKLQGNKYDIIIICCVLTSLPVLPDFNAVKNLIHDDGFLIVADIDPAYTALHPYYAFKANGDSFALKTNPINPLDLNELLTSSGLVNVLSKSVKKPDHSHYSYMMVYSL